MNLTVRVTSRLAGLTAKARALAGTSRQSGGGGTGETGLPSTSNLRGFLSRASIWIAGEPSPDETGNVRQAVYDGDRSRQIARRHPV